MKHQTWNSKHWTSNTKHHQTLNVKYKSSNIKHQSSKIDSSYNYKLASSERNIIVLPPPNVHIMILFNLLHLGCLSIHQHRRRRLQTQWCSRGRKEGRKQEGWFSLNHWAMNRFHEQKLRGYVLTKFLDTFEFVIAVKTLKPPWSLLKHILKQQVVYLIIYPFSIIIFFESNFSFRIRWSHFL